MLNFPNAPNDGDFSAQPNGVTYQWDATLERWTSIATLEVTPPVADPVVTYYGLVDGSNGDLSRTNGGTSAVRDSAGNYTISFDTPTDDNYSVQLTPLSGGFVIPLQAGSADANEFSARMLLANGGLTDASFYYLVIRQ